MKPNRIVAMFSGVALVVGTGAVAVASVGGISFTTAPATAQLVMARSVKESGRSTSPASSTSSSSSSSTSSTLLGANTHVPSMSTSSNGHDESTATGDDSENSTTSTPPG